MAPSLESGTAGPQLLGAIPWNSAKHPRTPGVQPGAALHGQLLNRGEAGIVEVGLEKTRTSKAYRAKLEDALALLLLWVATTCWAAVDWMSDATKCNEVLCEYVEKLHRGNGKLCLRPQRHSEHSVCQT